VYSLPMFDLIVFLNTSFNEYDDGIFIHFTEVHEMWRSCISVET
jgi:hypothetical protein